MDIRLVNIRSVRWTWAITPGLVPVLGNNIQVVSIVHPPELQAHVTSKTEGFSPSIVTASATGLANPHTVSWFAPVGKSSFNAIT